MISSIKKVVFGLLCNDVVGRIIHTVYKNKIPDLRRSKYHFDLSGSNISNQLIASVYWGFYEGAEIRFISKYFKGKYNVIELGASLGIVSAHLVSRMQKDRRYVGVEANKALAEKWGINTERNNTHGVNTILLNKAVHYDDAQVSFWISSKSTDSSLNQDNRSLQKQVTVPATSLRELTKEFNHSEYTLVCDIEGAEVEILMNDLQSLANCKEIFIELHDTNYKSKSYSIEDLKQLIISFGFELIDQYGPVCYFSKHSFNN